MSNANSHTADGPLSLIPTPRIQTGKDDPFTEDASQMALVHNMVIRAFNSIYKQAPKMRQEDVVDFLHYCSAWHSALKGHHDAEEEVYVPGIEEATGVKGIMDTEIHEHAAFSRGLDIFKDYIEVHDQCLGIMAGKMVEIREQWCQWGSEGAVLSDRRLLPTMNIST